VRYAPRAPVALLGALAAVHRLPAFAGGSVNWTWGADKFGEPHWVDLSESVGKWTDAADIDALDELAWTAPAAASMRSFPAQFVAAVLALGTNVARPSDALLSDAAFADECAYLIWSSRAVRNLSDAHLLSRCVLKYSSARSKEQAEASSANSVSELVQGAKDEGCKDLLGQHYLPSFEAVYMATLAQALPATGSCAGGCPFGRPLCNGTRGCVRPTCADFKPLCNNNTDAGALARYLCGVTCGCDDLTSDLLWIGPNLGCLPQCKQAAKALANETCSDAQPGSAELAAFVGYSRAFELRFASMSTNAIVRAELGCFALNFEFHRQTLCDQESWSTDGAKSLVPFCPVSCGCIDDPSMPGCPRACRAPEPPTLRDLSDAQLAVANAVKATWNKRFGLNSPAYPPSCLDLNATVCDALRTAWHKHPCPVACGVDPTAPSTHPPAPPPQPPPLPPHPTCTHPPPLSHSRATGRAPRTPGKQSRSYRRRSAPAAMQDHDKAPLAQVTAAAQCRYPVHARCSSSESFS
jgi:hypothetical protein